MNNIDFTFIREKFKATDVKNVTNHETVYTYLHFPILTYCSVKIKFQLFFNKKNLKEKKLYSYLPISYL